MRIAEEARTPTRAIERQLGGILTKIEEARLLLEDMTRDGEARAARRRKTV